MLKSPVTNNGILQSKAFVRESHRLSNKSALELGRR